MAPKINKKVTFYKKYTRKTRNKTRNKTISTSQSSINATPFYKLNCSPKNKHTTNASINNYTCYTEQDLTKLKKMYTNIRKN